MANWIMWLAAAGVLVILEMVTGTLYLLMIGFGLAAGALAALAGGGIEAQLITAGVVGGLATWGLHRTRFGKLDNSEASRDANVNMDIGQNVQVAEWVTPAGGPATARVMYRGALWDVELEPGAAAAPGSYIIREVRGSRLIVSGAR